MLILSKLLDCTLLGIELTNFGNELDFLITDSIRKIYFVNDMIKWKAMDQMFVYMHPKITIINSTK